MDLDEQTALVHQPVRLRLMTLLYQRGDVGASAVRNTLDITPGNLDAHARRLAQAGFVEARKVLTKEGFEARYRITRPGVQVFERYVEALQAFLASAPVGRPPA